MTTTELSVKMVIDRWNGSIASLNKHLEAISDEQLLREIAPGKNRGVYLLGHLVAVHDDMLVLLSVGAKMFPELHEPFITQPDKAATSIPSAAELRAFWKQQCDAVSSRFEQMTTEQWFEKHSAVSEEDFAKEPHRNKLNIVITRTSHLQYHSGQIILLK